MVCALGRSSSRSKKAQRNNSLWHVQEIAGSLGWLKLRVSVRDEAGEVERGYVMGALYDVLWTRDSSSWESVPGFYTEEQHGHMETK